MKYAFNTWAYGSFPSWLPSYTLDETIRRLARIGYDGIEIGCAAPHAWPAYLGAERRRELRRLMEGEGLPAVSLLPAPGGGPGHNPASPIPEERAATVAHYGEVIDLAADLGASYVLYIAGWQVFGSSRSACWEWTLDALVKIAARAAAREVTVVVEPTAADSNLIDTPHQTLELIAACGAPNVRAMIDTYHALYRDEVPADQIRVLAGDLAHVHVAGPNRSAPCDGAIDWRGVMEALREVGFDGHLTMEIGFDRRSADPDAMARQALGFLKAVERSLD